MQPVLEVNSDNHVHTRLCNHAVGEMEEYVQAAITRELRSLTFLEHMEIGIRYDHRTWLTEKDFAYYFREGERLKKKYGHRLAIRLGVEAGFNPDAVERLRFSLQQFPFERIGLSYHFYPVGGRHCNLVSRRQDNLRQLAIIGNDRIMDDYFSGLRLAVETISCDVICHLDAVLRYFPDPHFNDHHWQQIDSLLQTMALGGTALEINASGFTIRNQPHPCPRIVRRALDLQIPLTAGSDAHRPEHVGRHFNRLLDYLSSAARQPFDRPGG